MSFAFVRLISFQSSNATSSGTSVEFSKRKVLARLLPLYRLHSNDSFASQINGLLVIRVPDGHGIQSFTPFSPSHLLSKSPRLSKARATSSLVHGNFRIDLLSLEKKPLARRLVVGIALFIAGRCLPLEASFDSPNREKGPFEQTALVDAGAKSLEIDELGWAFGWGDTCDETLSTRKT